MKLKDLVEKVVKEWADGVSVEAIRRRTFSILDKGRDEIIYKMAGFDCRWSRWEVDNSNGRVSVVSDFVKKLARENVELWIKENIESLPKMTNELMSAFVDDYKKQYKRALERQLYNLASRHAVEDANRIAESFSVADLEFEDKASEAPEWE